MERLLSSFARSLQAPEQFPRRSGARISGPWPCWNRPTCPPRTGFPEEPARILQLAGPPPREGTSV